MPNTHVVILFILNFTLLEAARVLWFCTRSLPSSKHAIPFRFRHFDFNQPRRWQIQISPLLEHVTSFIYCNFIESESTNMLDRATNAHAWCTIGARSVLGWVGRIWHALLRLYRSETQCAGYVDCDSRDEIVCVYKRLRIFWHRRCERCKQSIIKSYILI